MPASAYGLVAVFTVVSAVSGWLAARLVGLRRPRSAVLPALAAFAILYAVGHRWNVRVGPQVTILGWEVSLAFDVAVAATTSLLVAVSQRLGGRSLEAQQRRAGRDRLT